MGRRAVTELRWLGILGVTAWLACACAPVDRWDVFDPDFDRSLQGKDCVALDAQRFQPEMAAGPQFEIQSVLEPLKVSIEDVTLLALRNNQDLRVQQLNPVIAGTYE